MPFSAIDILPDPPQRTDPPDDFADRADTFVVAMQAFAEQLNVFKAELETAAALIAAAPAYADPGLVALTGLTAAANKLAYFTGSGSSALTDFTSVARTLLAQTTQANMRSVGLGLGSAAVANTGDFDAAGAASSAVNAHVAAGDPHTQYLLESAVSSFILTLLDDTSQEAACATLGARRVVSSSLTANGGYIEYDDGLKETWGYVDVGANATGSYTVPHTHTTFILPVGLTRIAAGNASQQENCGISDTWTHTTVGSIDLYNAENFTIRLYLRTIGV